MTEYTTKSNKYYALLDEHIKVLQNVASIMHRAKEEVNKDLNMLAAKSIPLMESDTGNQRSVADDCIDITYERASNIYQFDRSQDIQNSSTLETDNTNSNPSHQLLQPLEPLDLDV